MVATLQPWLAKAIASCVENHAISGNQLRHGNHSHIIQLPLSSTEPVYLQLLDREQALLSDSRIKINATFSRRCQLPEGTLLLLEQAKLSIVSKHYSFLVFKVLTWHH